MERALTRRKLVALLCATAGAGCNSPKTDTPTDVSTETPTPTPTATPTPAPPSFEISYQHRDSVEIGSEITIATTVANTGGRAGRFSAPLSVKRANGVWRPGALQESGEIPPGEAVTVESQPYELRYLGEYVFRVGASAPTTRIRTRPASFEWGRWYRSPAGYQVRVRTPRLEQTYSYVDLDGIERTAPRDDRQWVFVSIELRNETDRVLRGPAASNFALFPSETQYDRAALLEQPIYHGEPYVPTGLQPGGEQTGYIPYEIPDTPTVADLRVVWAASNGDGDIAVSWQSEGLPPYRG